MPQDLPVIDAHVHTGFESTWFQEFCCSSQVNREYSLKALEREMRENNVVAAVAMGCDDEGRDVSRTASTPMGLESNYFGGNVFLAGGINPYKPGKESLARTRKAFQEGNLKGLKVYLGYYHAFADDERYKPFYELAEEFGAPVVFHTGDTFSDAGKLKYAHPLQLDELAVDYRSVNFVIAHCGNPWFLDTAAIVYKNKNAYADLSGLFVGGKPENGAWFSSAKLRELFEYGESYEKFIYGSDWPLIGMSDYLEFARKAVPGEHHKKVFYENAKKVFNLEA